MADVMTTVNEGSPVQYFAVVWWTQHLFSVHRTE